MVSISCGYQDAAVSIDIDLRELVDARRTPKEAWDGVHLMLRYQSPYRLYYVSVIRRDGMVVIKKKCPGGPSNGGTYHDLSPHVPFVTLLGQGTSFTTTIENEKDDSVRITLYDAAGRQLVSGKDEGVGCPPIREGGSIGIRGDNAEFAFTLKTIVR